MKKKIKNIYGRFFFFIFKLLPLQNKVVFSSYWGKNYNGNPKYISDEILKTNKKIKQVWLNNSGKKFNADPSIKVVKWGSIKMIYELATAKVWVDNHTKPFWVRKRKKQLYIETWHGGLGMKKIEADMGENLSEDAKLQIMHNSEMADIFISNSDFLTKIYRRAFWYKGPILECGFPRNDIFFYEKDELKKIKEKVYKNLNINCSNKVVLYAPTFRKNNDIEVYDIDYQQLIYSLEKKFGGNFVVLIRLHPRMKELSTNMTKFSEQIIDASDYDDMQELIISSDVFITDYSSGIFDFALMDKPGFIYASDIAKYEEERGLYFELNTLPFAVASNNIGLNKNIIEFDEETYNEKLKKYFDSVGLKEKGTASKAISKIVIDYIEKEKIEEQEYK